MYGTYSVQKLFGYTSGWKQGSSLQLTTKPVTGKQLRILYASVFSVIAMCHLGDYTLKRFALELDFGRTVKFWQESLSILIDMIRTMM